MQLCATLVARREMEVWSIGAFLNGLRDGGLVRGVGGDEERERGVGGRGRRQGSEGGVRRAVFLVQLRHGVVLERIGARAVTAVNTATKD